MSFLWGQVPPGKWQSWFLEGDLYRLLNDEPDAAQDQWSFPESLTGGADQVVMRRVRLDDGERWALLTGPQARVRHNAKSVSLGLAILAHRDEIVVADPQGARRRRFYFSTERVARVEPAPEGLPGPCPRCKQLIQSGVPSVCCPSCRVWHHQFSGAPVGSMPNVAPRVTNSLQRSTVNSAGPPGRYSDADLPVLSR